MHRHWFKYEKMNEQLHLKLFSLSGDHILHDGVV